MSRPPRRKGNLSLWRSHEHASPSYSKRKQLLITRHKRGVLIQLRITLVAIIVAMIIISY